MRSLLLVAALVVTACVADPVPITACTAGVSTACTCSSGATGAQVCAANGSGYGACVCTGGDAGADAAGDAVAVGDAGSDAAQVDAAGDGGGPRAAYQTCDLDGGMCAGAGVNCMPSQARSPDAGASSVCTATCPTGLAAACPGYLAGQVECVNLPGDMPFQCMRLCNAVADCAPYGTQCVQVVSKTGNTIRVCAP